jgi:acetyl esterase/lipase
MRWVRYVHNRKLKNRRQWLWWVVVAALPVSAWVYWWVGTRPVSVSPLNPLAPISQPKAGDVLGEDNYKSLTAPETQALARENYGGQANSINVPVTKISFHFRSELPGGVPITVYARAFLPESPKTDLPIFGFATGTTGIGDQCSPSLENPKVANWANYDSHMAMYAAHGFAAVTPDYEGMRDPDRIHHYMVGELEGRVMLDAVRALRRLPEARGRLSDNVFLGGYSQGGHAAFWADKVAAQYAPDVKPKGIVGFGPVMSVQETMTDVVNGANINWFGPYVLYSYHDYYGDDYGSVLLQHWQDTLAHDVPAHCIDTDIPFWGRSPEGVYTPEFLQAVKDNQLQINYLRLVTDLDRNAVGAVSTSSAKLINQGDHDNVVLPVQQTNALPALCQSSAGPVALKLYPGATHYTTMLQSFNDTVEWMRTLVRGQTVASTCK